MDDLSAGNAAAKQGKGRLLIVDDDPVAAGMLGLMLKKHGYQVRHVPSGEDCLAVMAEFSPEVVLLDIEMPGGIDGFETCLRVRKLFDRGNLTIMFLSGHDSLEDRLQAYDAGGDDFVAKPFEAEEIRRKIALAVGARVRRGQLVAEKSDLAETADVAMQSYGEMGAIVKFARGALGCRTLQALADLMVDSMRSNQSEAHVQLRGSAAAGTLSLGPQGLASPLEESVIEHMRGQGRLFQFKSRMIVNYDKVSVLVTNMPTDDEGLAGRVRDYAAMIDEAAEDAVENISLRADAVARAKELQALAESSREGLEKLQAGQRAQQLDTRCELERMAERIETMYYQFGLSDRQEAAISDTVRRTKEEVLRLFEQYGPEFDSQFASILEGLNQACDYEIDMAETASAPLVELW